MAPRSTPPPRRTMPPPPVRALPEDRAELVNAINRQLYHVGNIVRALRDRALALEEHPDPLPPAETLREIISFLRQQADIVQEVLDELMDDLQEDIRQQ